MTQGEVQDALSVFLGEINDLCHNKCPNFLTPNSHFMGVRPGHNLDLFEISFDFRIDRTSILTMDTPDVLKDPSVADLKVLK